MDKWVKAGVVGTYLCLAVAILGAFLGRNPSTASSPRGGSEVNYIPFVFLLIAALLMLATAAVYKGLWPFKRQLEIQATGRAAPYKPTRYFFLRSYVEQASAGSTLEYQAGQLYILDDERAHGLIASGTAMTEDDYNKWRDVIVLGQPDPKLTIHSAFY